MSEPIEVETGTVEREPADLCGGALSGGDDLDSILEAVGDDPEARAVLEAKAKQ